MKKYLYQVIIYINIVDKYKQSLADFGGTNCAIAKFILR